MQLLCGEESSEHGSLNKQSSGVCRSSSVPRLVSLLHTSFLLYRLLPDGIASDRNYKELWPIFRAGDLFETSLDGTMHNTVLSGWLVLWLYKVHHPLYQEAEDTLTRYLGLMISIMCSGAPHGTDMHYLTIHSLREQDIWAESLVLFSKPSLLILV